MTPREVMVGYYDYGFVTLSVLVAVMGGYCTIELAERVTGSRSRTRLYWWIGGSVAMAIGTWSMHYVAMLAFCLPIPVQYDWPTAFLSYTASLFANLLGLFVVSRRKMGFVRALCASIFMGGGIVALHYVAMDSMRLKGMCHYSPPLVSLSVVVAIGFSLLSLWLMFFFRETSIDHIGGKFGSALLLGAAISAMHYTGMAATSFTISDVLPNLSHAIPITHLGILGLGAANVMILAVVLLTSQADRLQERNLLLRSFSQKLVQAQETERRHLARELHDEVGQALTAAKISLQSAMREATGTILMRLQDAVAILDRLLVQVRQISLNLRPSMLDDLGLIPALRSVLDERARRASIEMHFSDHNVPENLHTEIQMTCFRIIQEAITNVVRHARATRIDVDLHRESGKLRLLIRDNGIGFDVESRTARLGLLGIKERAALVGGQAKIISETNKGTTIDISLPLNF
ncbi:MAG TPA: MHYT domain-containing protein [Chthoniobacterales bacterium]|jgi:signal transduction histidine kinase|nr:MHYT domain-containing protein [Chthoniobacterales bacterium]